jgi:hypothetical protein
MDMKKMTWKEIMSGTFSLLTLIALVLMYFFKSDVPDTLKGGILVAFVAAFKDFANYLVSSSSGSQAKDDIQATQTTKLIDAVANSQPTKN